MKLLVQRLLAGINLTALIALAMLAPATAQSNANLYFAPLSSNPAAGAPFTLELHVNPPQDIDTVHVVAHFPADQVSFDGVSNPGAPFNSVIPATPQATNGTVDFAVASLGAAVSNDTVVANLHFTAKAAATLPITISVNDSAAARRGQQVDLTTAAASVHLGGQSTGQSPSPNISQVTVDHLTTTSAVVHWHTNTATTGSVDYGQTTSYGQTASDNSSGTDHQVTLSGFAVHASVHYRISAQANAGSLARSIDYSFMTLGYPVQLTLLTPNGRPLAHTTVTIAGSSQKTDQAGTVFFASVGSGSQKVSVGNNTQLIAVKAVANPSPAAPQHFTLHVSPASNKSIWLTGIVALLLVLAAWLIRRAHPAKP